MTILTGYAISILIIWYCNIIPYQHTEVALLEHPFQNYFTTSTHALHQAVQHTACIMLSMDASSYTLTTIIRKTVENAMQFHTHINATQFCPIIY
jgi:hypothetical protein